VPLTPGIHHHLAVQNLAGKVGREDFAIAAPETDELLISFGTLALVRPEAVLDGPLHAHKVRAQVTVSFQPTPRAGQDGPAQLEGVWCGTTRIPAAGLAM
jgi:hypothetical protein